MEHMSELITSVVLVGGESKRFGSPKYQAVINGATFLEHIERALSPLTIKYSVHQPLPNIPCDLQIVDDNVRIGPINGIYNSLANANSKFLLVTSCDLPLLTTELVHNIIGQAMITNKTTIPIIDGYPMPTFAVYKQTDVAVFKQAINNQNYKLVDVLKSIDYTAYTVPSNLKANLTNVNTKRDLQKLHSPFIFTVSGFKNSGKTTLISKLITKYKQQNYQVAVLKHDGHDFVIPDDTDTGKFIHDGSDLTTVYSATKFQTTTTAQFNLNHWLEQVVDFDVVIIEGMKDSHYPKIVIENEQPLPATNRLLTINTNTRNDIDNIFAVLRKAENERLK